MIRTEIRTKQSAERATKGKCLTNPSRAKRVCPTTRMGKMLTPGSSQIATLLSQHRKEEGSSEYLWKGCFQVDEWRVFGKTVKSTRKRVDAKLVNDEMKRWKEKDKTYVTTTFQKEVNFYREFGRDRKEKKTLRLRKPISRGMTILHTS